MPSDPRPMTYYYCSTVTLALSRSETLFFSRWPWSDFSRSPKVKLIMPSYSQPMTSYLCSIVTIALSCTGNPVFQHMTLIWPFKVTKGQTDYTIWSVTHEFLLMLNSNYSAISLRLRDIRRQTSENLAGNPNLTFSKSLTSTDSSFHLTTCQPFPMHFIWGMSQWYSFYHLLCTFIYSAKNSRNLLKRASHNMAKFSKYFSTLGSPSSKIPQPNDVTIERPLQRYSFLYVYAKKSAWLLDIFDQMDNAHLSLRRTKNKTSEKRITR